jgi:tetratricopeptide (TPR) repeat protein
LPDRWNEWLRDHPWMVAGALALITFAVYGTSLAAGFVYDDEQQVVQNPYVLKPHLWFHIFTSSFGSFLGMERDVNFYRPLQFVSYWLVCRVAGINAGAFHLFQLCFYAACVWIVYRLGNHMFQNQLVAFTGALLWAVHPLHVEAVVWIASLPDVGFAFFYLLAFILFLRAEREIGSPLRSHVGAAFVYLPSLFFKEMAVTFPLMLLAWWFFCAPSKSWRRRALIWLPYVAAVGIYIAARIAVLGHLSIAAHVWQVTPLVLMTAIAFLGEHAKLFFWPAHLDIFRHFDFDAALRSPWPWLALLALAVALWTRRRNPLLSFAIVWWAVALLPCLDYRQLSTPLVADRFSYLPSVGLCLAIGHLAWQWLPQHAPRFVTRIVVPGLALLVALGAVRSVLAISVWNDTETLAAHALRQDPDAPVPHLIQGIKLQYQGMDFDGAEREYREARRLNRLSFRPLPSVESDATLGLGHVEYLRGNTSEAVRLFESAAKISPSPFAAYDALGSIFFSRRDYARAAEYFERAVHSNGQDFGGRFYLGTCWMKLARYHDAAEQFRALREFDPSARAVYEAEAGALDAAGDTAGAARVRALKPKGE